MKLCDTRLLAMKIIVVITLNLDAPVMAQDVLKIELSGNTTHILPAIRAQKNMFLRNPLPGIFNSDIKLSIKFNIGDRRDSDRSGLIYENYTRNSRRSEQIIVNDDDRPDSGVYETLRPRDPPSERIIRAGSHISAVLQSRIDTRNDGPINAMITHTVYDSKTMRLPLIPQGSQLVGSYAPNVTPDNNRIEVTFQRLILPDGRAFDLPEFPATDSDGTVGVKGRHHPNLLQSIGQSVLDFGPKWVESKMPLEVMPRDKATPHYYTVERGQLLKVFVTKDLEVPMLRYFGDFR